MSLISPTLAFRNSRKILLYISLPLILFSAYLLIEYRMGTILLLTISSVLIWVGLWGLIEMPQEKLKNMVTVLEIAMILPLLFIIVSSLIGKLPPFHINTLFFFVCIAILSTGAAILFLVLRYLRYISNPQETLGWFMKRAHGILVFSGALAFGGAAIALGYSIFQFSNLTGHMVSVACALIAFIGFGLLVTAAIMSYPLSVLVLGIRTTGKTVLRKKLATMYESISTNTMCVVQGSQGNLGFAQCVPDMTPRVKEEAMTYTPEAYIMRLGKERVLLYDLPGDVNMRQTWANVINEHKPKGIIFIMDHERGADPSRINDHKLALKQIIQFLEGAGNPCRVLLLLVTKFDDSCIGPNCERKGWAYSSIEFSTIISMVDEELKVLERQGVQILIHKSSGIVGVEDARLDHALKDFFEALAKAGGSALAKGSRILCPDCTIDTSKTIPNITVNLGVFNTSSNQIIFPEQGTCMNCRKFEGSTKLVLQKDWAKDSDYIVGIRLFNNLRGVKIKEFTVNMVVDQSASILAHGLIDGTNVMDKQNPSGSMLLEGIRYVISRDGDAMLLLSLRKKDRNDRTPIHIQNLVISSADLTNAIGFPDMIIHPNKVEFKKKDIAIETKKELATNQATSEKAPAPVPNIWMVNQTYSVNISDSIIYKSNIPIPGTSAMGLGLPGGGIGITNVSVRTNIKDSIVSRSEVGPPVNTNPGMAATPMDGSGKGQPQSSPASPPVAIKTIIDDSIISRNQVGGAESSRIEGGNDHPIQKPEQKK